MNVIVFGAGGYGKLYCQYPPPDKEVNIIAVADNSVERIGKRILEYDIISPDSINSYNYEKIVIVIENKVAVESIIRQLNSMGINNIEVFDGWPRLSPRIQSLYKMSELIESSGIQGNIAECGVYRGWSAVYLNEFYPNRKLFLFDTFKGFDERDMEQESSTSKSWFDKRKDEYSIPKNAEYILNKCLYPQNVIIKHGYVPETFLGLENETFAFVHLDMDMYKPQLAGLRFFSERMSKGGIIFLHDYYRTDLLGTKMAVETLSNEKKFTLIPAGGSTHIALVLH
jgi:O-methyltransferase